MNTGRVKVIDAASMTRLQYSPQAYNESSENSRLSTLRSNGATYVVQGDVEYIDINPHTLDNSKGLCLRCPHRIQHPFIDANTRGTAWADDCRPKDGSVYIAPHHRNPWNRSGTCSYSNEKDTDDDISISVRVLELIDTKTTKRGEEAKTIAL